MGVFGNEALAQQRRVQDENLRFAAAGISSVPLEKLNRPVPAASSYVGQALSDASGRKSA